MKYISDPTWKEFEKKGDITTASKLILREILYNLNELPPINLILFQSLYESYERFSYVMLLTNVPKDIFSDLKIVRRSVKKTIELY